MQYPDQDDPELSQEEPLVIGSRVFDMGDQQWFAGFSGDYNPLHIDPVAARREMYGEVVVHGIHGVLNALNDFLGYVKGGEDPIQIERLRVRFLRPMGLGATFKTVLKQRENLRFQLAIADAEQTVASIDGVLAPAQQRGKLPSALPKGLDRIPRDLASRDLRGRAGRLPLCWDAVTASERWANLSRLSPEGLSALCALTRLVGMECPGLRSIFSSFDLAWSGDCDGDEVMDYRVEDLDRRFSLVRLSVQGRCFSGAVEAFSRPPPQQQPTLAQVRQAVRPHEFRQIVAMIIGGSRGIGEVTAKIIAAGGGAVLLTYQRGEREARTVIDELQAAGFTARMARYEVGSPDVSALRSEAAELPRPINQAYYFPSPRIFAKQRAAFDTTLFQQFSACYVEGFNECCQLAKQISPGAVRVFYPSSEALDAPVKALAEYGAAKAAGEALCDHLNRFDGRLNILTTRLPRIATDQTLTLADVPSQPALDVMLPLVREMRDSR